MSLKDFVDTQSTNQSVVTPDLKLQESVGFILSLKHLHETLKFDEFSRLLHSPSVELYRENDAYISPSERSKKLVSFTIYLVVLKELHLSHTFATEGTFLVRATAVRYSVPFHGKPPQVLGIANGHVTDYCSVGYAEFPSFNCGRTSNVI